jgi:hypothetical protein
MCTVAGEHRGKFYGLVAWNEWKRSQPKDLSEWERPSAPEWDDNPVELVASFRDLVQIVAFLQVMNKRRHLVFRGQSGDFEPTPTITRKTAMGPTGVAISPAADLGHYLRELRELGHHVSRILVRDGLPRSRPFEHSLHTPQRRVAPWSVIQHYELWPTPMLDVTTSLRVAATFAIGLHHAVRGESARSGFLYVFALDSVDSDVMELKASSRFAAVRLSAVCPPDTLRPHLQEGLLVGDPMFESATSHRPPLTDRLVAKFRLEDDLSGGESQFWDDDFPPHSSGSLLPEDDVRERLLVGVEYRWSGRRLCADISHR